MMKFLEFLWIFKKILLFLYEINNSGGGEQKHSLNQLYEKRIVEVF